MGKSWPSTRNDIIESRLGFAVGRSYVEAANRSFACGGMNRKPVAAPVSISNELVIATIGLIGILVDVHVTDGSVYSGIFHAASVDGDYGIVLKKARIAKKGNLLTNIVDDTALDTLVIGSETLVQIVAKAGCQIGVNEITASVDIRYTLEEGGKG
ncbi:hypothetical protein M569_10033 [Genlisea aurea]|uniref:Ataxin 2 SM domain-containing protein n=1 Tax=Genlisea aurea TaxID=192259 RepID=S8DNZ3_9LAMI|nr:hypothetical protein M569_10033 [Genlisea aurea]